MFFKTYIFFTHNYADTPVYNRDMRSSLYLRNATSRFSRLFSS